MIDALLTPVDALRARLYRLFGGWVAPWVSDRELRAAAIGVFSILTAFALALGAPLWLLAIGPIVLGVPHVLADIRYLWVHPGFHRQRRVWAIVVPALLVGAVTAQVFWAIVAATVALFAVDASWQRRAIGVTVLVPLAYVAWRWSSLSTLAFAHLHNLVAVALWWALWRRKKLWHYAVIATFAVGSVLIASGVLDGAILAVNAWFSGGLAGRGMMYHARSLAPFAEPMMGMRFAVAFAFAQAVHYAIWLRLVPEDARTRPSPRPFRSSWAALKMELGVVVLGLATLAAIVFAVWAALDLWAARDGYLRAAIFHGHLELAAAALLFASRSRVPRGA